MSNPFVIFAFMVWFALTAGAWLIGLAGLIGGASDGDGVLAGIGAAFLLGAMLSTSFFLATLD